MKHHEIHRPHRKPSEADSEAVLARSGLLQDRQDRVRLLTACQWPAVDTLRESLDRKLGLSTGYPLVN